MYFDPSTTPFSEIEAAALNVLCSVEWVTLRTKLRTDLRPPEVAHVSPRWPALSSTIPVHCLCSRPGGFILLTREASFCS